MRNIKIFIASSLQGELSIDRVVIGNFVRQLNTYYHKRDINIQLFECEDFDAAYNGVRKQDEYNAHIYDSDMFIAIFHKSVGKYTLEEFKEAVQSFQAHKKPKVYVYIRDFDVATENLDLQKLQNYICNDLGHMVCPYNTHDSLKLLLIMHLLQVEGTPSADFLKISHSHVMLEQDNLIDLDKVSFATNNPDYQALAQQLTAAQKRLEDARKMYNMNPDNDVYFNEIMMASQDLKTVQKKVESYQNNLFELAKKFSMLTSDVYSQRIAEAYSLFEQGKVTAANKILNMEKLDAENDFELDNFIQHRKNILVHIEEYTLKVKTVMADLSIVPEQRLEQAHSAYLRAIRSARALGNYDPEKMADLLYGFAKFSYLHKQYHWIGNLLEDAEQIYRTLAEKTPEQQMRKVVLSLNYRGRIYTKIKEYDKAEKLFKEALPICRELSKCGNNEDLDLLALILNSLTILYMERQNYVNAEKTCEEALQIRTRLAELDPAVYLRGKIVSQINKHNVLYAMKKGDLGESLLLEALQSMPQLQQYDPERCVSDKNAVRQNLAIIYAIENRYAEAEQLLLDTVEEYRALILKQPECITEDLGNALENLGVLYGENHQYDTAEIYFKESFDLYKKLAKTNPDIYRECITRSEANLKQLYEEMASSK